MYTDKHRFFRRTPLTSIAFLSVFICVHLWTILLSSCSTNPTDMRSLVPADSLVYLETNDLAAALQPIVNSKPFNDVAKTKPDLSALKGVQLAVAVTGFQMTEEKLTDENSVANVQPRFVAVADTHAWNYQARAFADQSLGQFVTDIYGADVTQDRIEKNGGEYFTWTANDGRKSFAQVIDSLIWFGNDESAIEKCLAVRRGEADSIAKTGKIQPAEKGTVASGYVSTDGIAQIGNVLALQVAGQASEESEVQTAIATILPQILRGSATDVSWTATRNGGGFEDKYTIRTTEEIGPVLHETLQPSVQMDRTLFRFAPGTAPGITHYNLERPNIAWRSLLLVSQSRTDAVGSRVIGEFSTAFSEPYGIADPEFFLSGVGQNIITMRVDREGEKPALIAKIANVQIVRRALDADLKPNAELSQTLGVEILMSDDETMAAFYEDKIVVGDKEAVTASVKAKSHGNNLEQSSPAHVDLFRTGVTATTLSTENELSAAIADLLSEKITDSSSAFTVSVIRTHFTKNSVERRTVSDFGLIGSILAQLAGDK